MWNPFSRGGTVDESVLSVADNTSPQLEHTIKEINGKVVNSVPVEKEKTIKQFIDESPNSLYIIDGKKGEPQSIICRAKETGGKTCLNLHYEAVQLFKQMQKFEYFCSLPNDTEATYFECRKIR